MLWERSHGFHGAFSCFGSVPAAFLARFCALGAFPLLALRVFVLWERSHGFPGAFSCFGSVPAACLGVFLCFGSTPKAFLARFRARRTRLSVDTLFSNNYHTPHETQRFQSDRKISLRPVGLSHEGLLLLWPSLFFSRLSWKSRAARRRVKLRKQGYYKDFRLGSPFFMHGRKQSAHIIFQEEKNDCCFEE